MRSFLALIGIFVLASESNPLTSIPDQTSYNTPQWKEEIVNGYLPYHRLVRSDFPIDDNAHPEAQIYTAGFFHYDYNYRFAKRKGRIVAHITQWIVRSGFDQNKSSRKSWFSDVENALPHEQGHLDINEMHTRKFASLRTDKLPSGEGATSLEASLDLKTKLDALAEQCSRDAQSEQDEYDTETAHGANQSKQQVATATIQARLERAR